MAAGTIYKQQHPHLEGKGYGKYGNIGKVFFSQQNTYWPELCHMIALSWVNKCVEIGRKIATLGLEQLRFISRTEYTAALNKISAPLTPKN